MIASLRHVANSPIRVSRYSSDLSSLLCRCAHGAVFSSQLGTNPDTGIVSSHAGNAPCIALSIGADVRTAINIAIPCNRSHAFRAKHASHERHVVDCPWYLPSELEVVSVAHPMHGARTGQGARRVRCRQSAKARKPCSRRSWLSC